MENLLLLYLFIINIISFICIFVDKQRAINHKWRISEYTLIFLAIIGGSLGSISGMYIFRHKTKKAKFKMGIPIIILIQFLFLQSF